ncbi:UNVERIFIED_CONTAM: hypothetical protein Sradi_2351100 [Sesamum radiatum]|uniref:Uncharacterized protein n=1 Tax=Sesamum radiatum TaxID=300843 RepID=A0AAW2T5M6_SESRA
MEPSCFETSWSAQYSLTVLRYTRSTSCSFGRSVVKCPSAPHKYLPQTVPLLHPIGSSHHYWKSVYLSTLSPQLSLGGRSLCLSLHSLPRFWLEVCASLHSLPKFCVVPQDSVSNTPELIWNDGGVESVFLKTVLQMHPTDLKWWKCGVCVHASHSLPHSRCCRPRQSRNPPRRLTTLEPTDCTWAGCPTVETTQLVDRTYHQRVLLTQHEKWERMLSSPA